VLGDAKLELVVLVIPLWMYISSDPSSQLIRFVPSKAKPVIPPPGDTKLDRIVLFGSLYLANSACPPDIGINTR
jgi:hypothetical protein